MIRSSVLLAENPCATGGLGPGREALDLLDCMSPRSSRMVLGLTIGTKEEDHGDSSRF